MTRPRFLRPAALATMAALALLATAGAALAADGARDASAVVTAFNEALTARNLDKALTHFAPGAVQFNLRPAHAGMPGSAPQELVSDLRAHWGMIGSVLISSTKSYVRKVEVIDSRAEGDVATVWTRTTTESTMPDNPSVRRDSFVETYLLVRKDGAWMIGAVADNRQPQASAGGKSGGP